MNTTKLREKKKRIIEKLLAAMSSSIGSILTMVLLVLVFAAGINLKFGNGQDQEQYWCVAKPSASEKELLLNIEYACNNLGDCKLIQPGGSCFNPDTLVFHASVVMNQYFAKNQRTNSSCYFGNTGLIVYDPISSGGRQDCVFA
ncbi:major pollen allergen Ole e 10-like [Vicia villosa]|uniref:major pollen allergen Ole e 10-like n=1 Tax=Vicia villosa TaxID=3911 RepID=UPI00273CC69F|nr:major pollen allergen Ole e 10-like [Vicia villosa]